MENRQIAVILDGIVVFSKHAGKTPIKVRSFEAGARIVEKLPESAADLAVAVEDIHAPEAQETIDCPREGAKMDQR
jgi:hypothetical protein